MTSLRQLRDAYASFAKQFEPNTMVTLSTHQFWSVEKMRKLVGAFAARMDDAALGSTWSKMPPSKRANGAFFIEHVGSNVHAHGLVRFPYGDHESRSVTAATIWNRLCLSGTIDLKEIYEIEGAADYCTKEMMRHHNEDQVVLLADFMSKKPLAQEPTKQR